VEIRGFAPPIEVICRQAVTRVGGLDETSVENRICIITDIPAFDGRILHCHPLTGFISNMGIK
jgi:hypothetical protein